MKALVIGNGPSLKGWDPRSARNKFDFLISCNHTWQQWPDLDAYVMADRKNIDYTNDNASQDILKRVWIKSLFFPNFPHLNSIVTGMGGDISGSLGIRLAAQLGYSDIYCVGFDSLTEGVHEKAYTDVPWKKAIPKNVERWHRIMEQTQKEIKPSSYRYTTIKEIECM